VRLQVRLRQGCYARSRLEVQQCRLRLHYAPTSPAGDLAQLPTTAARSQDVVACFDCRSDCAMCTASAVESSRRFTGLNTDCVPATSPLRPQCACPSVDVPTASPLRPRCVPLRPQQTWCTARDCGRSDPLQCRTADSHAKRSETVHQPFCN
jgi:hypothetical protein